MTETVTGYSAERMRAIEDASIVNGEVDATGHLILTRHDGSDVDGGKILYTTVGVVPGAPTSGSWNKGEIVIDSVGVAWICTTAGTPGTWDDLSSGKRLGGFVGTSGVQVQLTTVNQTADIPGVSASFTKGGRPVRASFIVRGVYNTLTTRWPSVEVWDETNTVIWSQTVPILLAGSPMDVNVVFEPTSQPSSGVHTWRGVFRHSSGTTPGTATIAAATPCQLNVYAV